MRVSVLFCRENDSPNFDGRYSRLVTALAKLAGYTMSSTHVALLVDLRDIGGTSQVYELTMEGIGQYDGYDANNEWLWEDARLLSASVNYELDGNDPASVRATQEVLTRIEAAVLADVKADWVDLLRAMFHRPMLNFNCVSFVRYALGYYRDDSIVTPDDLLTELIEEQQNEN